MWDMFNRYPYVNLTDRNLDFLTKAIREMQDEVKNFVSLNAVKYANPIQWNINKQYEKNTIVIDPLTGTAFISVQPVPMGVALTRTEYWTPVFDLSQFVTKAAQNFANSYERDITTTATMATGAGDWVVWDSRLYVALNAIHAGDSYVVGGNIKLMTVEDFYDLLMDAIQNLDEELDTEIRNRTNADTTLQHNIDTEAQARGNADTTLQHNIDTEAQTRRNADIDLSGKIGALSDLSTNAKNNVVAAVNEVNLRIAGEINDRINAINDERGAWAEAVAGVNGRINDVIEKMTPLGYNTITVSKTGSDFNTINAAVNAVRSHVSINNPVTIIITSGVYVEDVNLTDINGLSFVGVGDVTIQSNSIYPMACFYVTGTVSFFNLHMVQTGDSYCIHSDTQGTNKAVHLTAYNCTFQRIQMSAGTYQHCIGWGSCDVGGDTYDIFNCNFIGGTALGGHMNPFTSATGIIAWRVQNCTFAVERCTLDWGDACRIINGTPSEQRIAAVFNGNKGNKGIIVQIAAGESYNFFPANSFTTLYYSGGNNIPALNDVKTSTYWNIDSFAQNGAVGLMFIPIPNAHLYDCAISYAHIMSNDVDIISACSIYGVSPNGLSIQISDYSTIGANAVQIGVAVSPNLVSAI